MYSATVKGVDLVLLFGSYSSCDLNIKSAVSGNRYHFSVVIFVLFTFFHLKIFNPFSQPGSRKTLPFLIDI